MLDGELIDGLNAVLAKHKAENREVDTVANEVVEYIILTVASTMYQSEMVAFTPKGHYLDVSLTEDGRTYLWNAIEPLVRGKLLSQRLAGQMDEMAARRALGFVP
jgi:hypothetical protein